MCSPINLYKLIQDYEADISANKLKLIKSRRNIIFNHKKNNVQAIEFLPGFWLVRALSSTPDLSGMLHSEIAFHLPR